jgi:hypothetical protein
MSAKNRRWPASAFVTLAVVIIVFSISLWMTNTHTRESYRAVGFNDGRIEQRLETIENLAQIVTMEPCRDDSAGAGYVPFLAVKSEAVLIRTTDGSQATFCRYPQAASKPE